MAGLGRCEGRWNDIRHLDRLCQLAWLHLDVDADNSSELHSRCVGSALEPIQHELDVVEAWWEPQKLEGPGGARYRDPLALKGVRSQGDRDTWQREPLRVVGGPPHGACLTPLCKGLRRGGE